MTKRYTGGVISSSLPTVNAAGASGVFLLSQQADYQSRNSWPPFKVEESLRFRSSASATLSRTPPVTSNRRTWTASLWFKRGTLGVAQILLGALGSSRATYINLNASNQLQIYSITSAGGGDGGEYVTTQVFRDPAAWYHLVIAYDSTQATSTNRIRLWVNGQQVTEFATSTAPTLNHDTQFNWTGATMNIGSYNSAFYIDGYLAEVNFIDGQQLEASSFGATDKDGNWSPIAYTGTYGTNGFYVNFRDNTSATTMGYDYSGNGNNWTLNNFNVSTANTTYDIMIDVPEDQDSANTRGNYCTLNPLSSGSFNTLSDGNLKAFGNTVTNNGNSRGTFNFLTGKWYVEMTVGATATGAYPSSGLIPASNATTPNNGGTNQVGYPSNSVAYENNGNKRVVNSTSAYGNSYTTGDIIGIAIDADNGAIYFSKNGTFQNSGVPTSGASKTGSAFNWTGGSIEYAFATAQYNGSDASFNFGQRPFTYTPPTGFKTLNTFNLPEPTIKQPSQYMNATLWSGNNTSNREIITGGRSDFVWIKRRDSATSHILFDAIRGAGKTLYSHLTSAEVDNGGYYVQTFGTTSFTLGTGGDAADNITGGTYVGWSWNAGGSTVTNTSGSISAQVRANPTAGFSIATYTGTGSIATIGHGLGVAPAMIIIKARSAVQSWLVYHQSIGNTGFVYLNETTAATFSINGWNNTSPTSTVFTTGVNSLSNQNGQTQVAYCFAPIAGYSAFGSYTGNGSTDGPFVFTGFRPRFVMTKRTDSSSGGNWTIIDGARNPYNVTNLRMYADTSDADGAGNIVHDFVSNGFKVRQGDSSTNNISGATYIYMAFAEAPFKYARSR